MRNLPLAIIHVLRQFEAVFSERVWDYAKVLVVGAILAPGIRTVTGALRVLGLQTDQQFQNYHRVLNRASWSSRALSRILLRLLIRTFVSPDAPIVGGVDEHHPKGTRAPTRGQDCRQRHLPRCRALQQIVLCQNQWAALGLDDAVDTHSLG